mmetsp:Transcript_19110/g.32582  ORF Transcript_19110/g.32582 Transcript_19110/m.32582 type:complete len:84 (+) Transcript_19110:17-268(+)
MVTKEEGLAIGTHYFGYGFLALAALLGTYVFVVTKDRAQAKDNFVMSVLLSLLACVCMWSMWAMAYMHQMYPIILPELAVESH